MSMAIGAYHKPYQAVSRAKMSFSSQLHGNTFPLLAKAREIADNENVDAGLEFLRTEHDNAHIKQDKKKIFNATRDLFLFAMTEGSESAPIAKQLIDASVKLVGTPLGMTSLRLKGELLRFTEQYGTVAIGEQLPKNTKRNIVDNMTRHITYEFCSKPNA